MKKPIILFVMLILIGTILFPNTVSATDFTKYPRTSVYCSGNEQNSAYELLQKEWDYSRWLEGNGLEIVKESITPVYVIDTVEYARTGKLEIVPAVDDQYIAKTVTADGSFGGNLGFYIENDTVHGAGFVPSYATNAHNAKDGDESYKEYNYEASCSYADHARRIQELLGIDEFVPVENVKYVVADGWGPIFYINYGGEEFFVDIGFVYTRYPTGGTDRILYFDEEFKEFADRKLAEEKKWRREKTVWELVHPGETWIVPLGVGSVSMPFLGTGLSDVDNIINIAEYLNIDLSVDPELEQAIAAQTAAENQANTNYKWLYVVSCAAVITAVCAAIVISKKRKGV